MVAAPLPFTPALLKAKDAALYCGCSLRHWQLKDDARQVPAAIEAMGMKRWRRSDLDLWIEIGCPAREDFEAQARLRRRGAA